MYVVVAVDENYVVVLELNASCPCPQHLATRILILIGVHLTMGMGRTGVCKDL